METFLGAERVDVVAWRWGDLAYVLWKRGGRREDVLVVVGSSNGHGLEWTTTGLLPNSTRPVACSLSKTPSGAVTRHAYVTKLALFTLRTVIWTLLCRVTKRRRGLPR